MRAAVFTGADKPLVVEAVPDPEPGPGGPHGRPVRTALTGSDGISLAAAAL